MNGTPFNNIWGYVSTVEQEKWRDAFQNHKISEYRILLCERRNVSLQGQFQMNKKIGHFYGEDRITRSIPGSVGMQITILRND
jgi:hypothetical protein